MPKILILNGPNLNLLGIREPDIYGTDTLQDIENICAQTAQQHHLDIDFRQSNHEGLLVDWIQETMNEAHMVEGIIINAAAYTHTSVAIHDALKMVNCPIIEVHLSDPATREEFRHFSYISPIAQKIIKGKGVAGYSEAIKTLSDIINT